MLATFCTSSYEWSPLRLETRKKKKKKSQKTTLVMRYKTGNPRRRRWSFSHALAGGTNMDKWLIFGVFCCFEGQAFHVVAMNLLLFLFRVRAQKEISWQLLRDRTTCWKDPTILPLQAAGSFAGRSAPSLYWLCSSR
jgi:hypothetical protein